MKVPTRLIFFIALVLFIYLKVLPKHAHFMQDLIKKSGLGKVSREDSVKDAVQARIMVDVCPAADLNEYKAGAWSDYSPENDIDAAITHEFTCDGNQRKFLFRLHRGIVNEIVDLR